MTMDTELCFDIKPIKENSLSFSIPTCFPNPKIITPVQFLSVKYNILNNANKCN